jgi:hypothetical protein
MKIKIVFLSFLWLTATGMNYAADSKIPGLMGSVFSVPHISEDTSAEVQPLRESMLDAIETRLNQILYAPESKEKALHDGRRIFKDNIHGTITIVDTKENLKKAGDYLESLKNPPSLCGTQETQPYLQSRIITLKHADPTRLRNLLNQIIQESKQYAPAESYAPAFFKTTLIKGIENRVSYQGLSVELIGLLGKDSTDYQAHLNLITHTGERETTLLLNESVDFDSWRVRLLAVYPSKQEVEIEIRKPGP